MKPIPGHKMHQVNMNDDNRGLPNFYFLLFLSYLIESNMIEVGGFNENESSVVSISEKTAGDIAILSIAQLLFWHNHTAIPNLVQQFSATLNNSASGGFTLNAGHYFSANVNQALELDISDMTGQPLFPLNQMSSRYPQQIPQSNGQSTSVNLSSCLYAKKVTMAFAMLVVSVAALRYYPEYFGK